MKKAFKKIITVSLCVMLLFALSVSASAAFEFWVHYEIETAAALGKGMESYCRESDFEEDVVMSDCVINYDNAHMFAKIYLSLSEVYDLYTGKIKYYSLIENREEYICVYCETHKSNICFDLNAYKEGYKSDNSEFDKKSEKHGCGIVGVECYEIDLAKAEAAVNEYLPDSNITTVSIDYIGEKRDAILLYLKDATDKEYIMELSEILDDTDVKYDTGLEPYVLYPLNEAIDSIYEAHKEAYDMQNYYSLLMNEKEALEEELASAKDKLAEYEESGKTEESDDVGIALICVSVVAALVSAALIAEILSKRKVNRS